MGRNRTAVQGVDRLQISDGDWIEVKKELNTGDQKRLEGAGLKPPVLVNGRIINPIDWGLYEIEKVLIWLTDWSLVGADDKVLTVNIDAVRSLDTETFQEINDVIEMHKRMVDEAKKSQRELRMASAKNSLTPASPEPELKS